MGRMLVIGSVLDGGGSAIAYKLFDDTSKKSAVIPLKRLKELISSRAIQVPGMAVYSGSTGGLTLKKRKVFHPPTLNASGEPIDVIPRYVLVECIGFLEAASYRIVDGRGVEVIVSEKEFKPLVEAGRIGGAVIRSGKIWFTAGFEYRAPSKIGGLSI